jgi:glyoxylate reductase
MGKVFITRSIPDIAVKLLKDAGHRVRVWPKDGVIPRLALLRGVKGCEAVLSLLTDRIDAEVLDAAGPQLRIVANYAVGYDNFDLKAFKARKVLAANTPGVLNDAVAEHTFALLMACAKRLVEADRFVRAGKYKGWEPLLLLGTLLTGKTLGIIGLGRIGAGVARRAVKGMGMQVLYYDVRRDPAFEEEYGARFSSVERILKEADVVSLHVPLLPSTRHLIGAKQLRMMKRTAYLINTARGPIVDEKALVAALKAKRIAGAGLDVYEDEPRLAPGLAKLPNVTLTPHTASAAVETRNSMAVSAARAIIEALEGKRPQNLVPTP